MYCVVVAFYMYTLHRDVSREMRIDKLVHLPQFSVKSMDAESSYVSSLFGVGIRLMNSNQDLQFVFSQRKSERGLNQMISCRRLAGC